MRLASSILGALAAPSPRAELSSRTVAELDRIRQALERHRAEILDPGSGRRAAVAVVLRPAEAGPELLFIERSEHPLDPWSGHMAFPGGRVDPHDATAAAAAERETAEEVGLELAGAERLGRLDDLEGRHAGRPAGLVVSAFVYAVAQPPALRPNHEVRAALWVPLQQLVEPARRVDYRPASFPRDLPAYPGIVVGDPERHVVWGLTYRFLEGFFEVLGSPFPDRWAQLRLGA